jgi:hypothetical protein
MIIAKKAENRGNDGMVKVGFCEPDGVVETLWATPLGRNWDQLENSPFFAYRVSWKDMIEAKPEVDGVLFFVRVVEKSGHRTVRLLFEKLPTTGKRAKPILDGLVQRGCSYEGMAPRLISVDVPPSVDLEMIADYLTGTGVRWEYADPKYEDLFPEEGD